MLARAQGRPGVIKINPLQSPGFSIAGCESCKEVFTDRSKLLEHQQAKKCTGRATGHLEIGKSKHFPSSKDLIEKTMESASTVVNGSFKKEIMEEPGDLQCEDAKQDINKSKLVTKCEHCNVKVSARTMNVHITRFHKEYLMNFKCDICVYSYRSTKSVRNHMRLQHKDRSFICSICAQIFLMKKDLRQHLQKEHEFAIDNANAAVANIAPTRIRNPNV